MPDTSAVAAPLPCPTGVPHPAAGAGARHAVLAKALAACILATAWWTYALVFVPLLPLLFVAPRAFRAVTDRFAGAWFAAIACVFEVVAGVRVRVSGTDLRGAPRGERALLVANHRCRFDWMFLWVLLARTGRLAQLKIVLKDSLRAVPAVGWCMQVLFFVFLRRNWADDKARLARLLAHLRDSRYPYQLLLFPEGTDLSDENRARSAAFAAKKGLEQVRFTLHPRLLGFRACVEALGDSLDAVYDVTIAYDGAVMQNEKLFLAGAWPSDILVHVKRLPPPKPAAADDWLRALWARKETRLARWHRRETDALHDAEDDDEGEWPGGDRPPLGQYLLGVLTMVAVAAVGCALVWASPAARAYVIGVAVIGVGAPLVGVFFEDFECRSSSGNNNNKKKQ